MLDQDALSTEVTARYINFIVLVLIKVLMMNWIIEFNQLLSVHLFYLG